MEFDRERTESTIQKFGKIDVYYSTAIAWVFRDPGYRVTNLWMKYQSRVKKKEVKDRIRASARWVIKKLKKQMTKEELRSTIMKSLSTSLNTVYYLGQEFWLSDIEVDTIKNEVEFKILYK